MLDLLVQNGTIIDGIGSFRGSVGVRDSRIVARFAEGEELPAARRSIDADECLVLPGLVDPHVHLYGDGFAAYSRLAAMGGVTTSIAMIRGEPEEKLDEVTSRHQSEGEAGSLLDFSFHVVLYDRPETLGQIAELAAKGFHSYKMFLAYKNRGMMSGEEFLFAAMDEIHRTRGIALIHSENGELVDRLERAAVAGGQKLPEHYAPTRPPEAEASAIGVVALASQATGCPAYIVHVSSADGLAAVENARHRGVRLWAETCPQYILMDDDALRAHGAMARIAPPLRTPADRRALGTALSTGAINTLGTDHACYSIEAKAKGADDIFKAPYGMPGAPLLWPSMFTWARDEGIAPHVLVRAMAHMPAAIFGMGHRKGTLAPGADADIVIVDPVTPRVVDAEHLWPGICPHPLAGQSLVGWPRTTISRGEIVWDEGEVTAKYGRGRLVEQRGYGHA
jgi:dihydroorotase-like cyclic amidohydrolase